MTAVTRAAAAAFLVISMIGLVGTRAHAQPEPIECPRAICMGDEDPGTPPGTTPIDDQPDPGLSPDAPIWQAVIDRAMPEECWRVTSGGAMTLAQAVAWGEFAYEFLRELFGLGALDRCPADPGVLATEWWIGVDVPAPDVEIPPGYAVTGLKTYMVIDGVEPISDTITAPGVGTVTLTATPSFIVDWGNGNVIETEEHGIPHPGGEGEITNVYQHADPHTVEVTAVWTASYTINGGEPVELAGVHLRPTTVDLPVEQVQAIRNR